MHFNLIAVKLINVNAKQGSKPQEQGFYQDKACGDTLKECCIDTLRGNCLKHGHSGATRGGKPVQINKADSSCSEKAEKMSYTRAKDKILHQINEPINCRLKEFRVVVLKRYML